METTKPKQPKPSIGTCSLCGKEIRPWGSYTKTEEGIMHGGCYTSSIKGVHVERAKTRENTK